MLDEIELEWSPVTTGSPEGAFIQEAQKRIELFQSQNERIPGFEASNYHAAAGVLHAIRQQGLATGNRLCEWGSGFGVVTCLATMAGYDARGIETEAKLVECSRQLARHFGIGSTFQQGSYRADLAAEPESGMSAETDRPAPSPFDCDVVYIYPWPAEKAYVRQLFERMATPGALMVSYRGGGRFRIRRMRDEEPA